MIDGLVVNGNRGPRGITRTCGLLALAVAISAAATYGVDRIFGLSNSSTPLAKSPAFTCSKTFHTYGDVELATGRSEFVLDVPTGAAIEVDDQPTDGLVVFQAVCFGPNMPRALLGGTPEQVRVAWNDSRAGVWRMGPVVMVLNALSDTHLATASSGQSTWMYAPITPSGPLAIRLSNTTGQVVQQIRMPFIDRPIGYTTTNGFWLYGGDQGAETTKVTVFHVGPSSVNATEQYEQPLADLPG